MNRFSWKHVPLLCILSAGFLTGCQKSPEERLLGQWKSTEQISIPGQGDENPARSRPLLELAFFDDETCTFRINKPVPFAGGVPTLSCDWVLYEDDLLKLEIRMPNGDTLVETFNAGFDGDRLELGESNGSSNTFEKVPSSG